MAVVGSLTIGRNIPPSLSLTDCLTNGIAFSVSRGRRELVHQRIHGLMVTDGELRGHLDFLLLLFAAW